jgi:haloalkane dehalogenase
MTPTGSRQNCALLAADVLFVRKTARSASSFREGIAFMSKDSVPIGTNGRQTPPFTEHRIPQGQGNVYARDYAGAAPAFVLMHGFPDNLHIYDELIPYLVSTGRRVVAFDFLGFGASDKPAGATYSFRQQLDDLEAVVDALGLETVVPVAHDASGPAGINFTLAHADRVAMLCILNSGYDDAFPVLWPELVALFADKKLKALSTAISQNPQQFEWLLLWQQKGFRDALPPSLRSHFDSVTAPLIANNFTQTPSAGPAFAQLASDFFDELARNSARLPMLRTLEVPVKVIWGELDPYISAEVAKDRVSHFRRGSLLLLPAGHWVQSDLPEQVAALMLGDAALPSASK